MANPTRIGLRGGPARTRLVSTWREVATALVKAQRIHEGHWRIQLKYDTVGANVNIANYGPTMAVMAPICEVALVRLEMPDDFTVDAAEVNPAPVEDAPKSSLIVV